MTLKELIVKYDYLKNKGGIIELEEELKELEESKYSIRANNFNERVQESRISNDMIENINVKIEKLKDRINRNKELVNDIDYFFGLVLKKEFNMMYDLYINFKNERKFKVARDISGSTLYRYKRVVGEEMQMIIKYNRDIFLQ